MKITMPKMFYTIHELSERWEISVDEVSNLMFWGFIERFDGLTNSLTPTLFASRMGLKIPLSSHTLKNANYIIGKGIIVYKDVEITPIFPSFEIERIENECRTARDESEKEQQSTLSEFFNLDAKAAFLEFWQNTDKNDRAKHPINKTVVNWLIENRNVSKTKAARIATDIRPKWGAKGRRKKK